MCVNHCSTLINRRQCFTKVHTLFDEFFAEQLCTAFSTGVTAYCTVWSMRSKFVGGGKVGESGAPAALWRKLLYLCNLL